MRSHFFAKDSQERFPREEYPKMDLPEEISKRDSKETFTIEIPKRVFQERERDFQERCPREIPKKNRKRVCRERFERNTSKIDFEHSFPRRHSTRYTQGIFPREMSKRESLERFPRAFETDFQERCPRKMSNKSVQERFPR